MKYLFMLFLFPALSVFAQNTAVFPTDIDLSKIENDRVHLHFKLEQPLDKSHMDALNELTSENAPIMDITIDNSKVEISLFHRSSVRSTWTKIFYTIGIETFVIQHSKDKFSTGTLEDWLTYYKIAD